MATKKDLVEAYSFSRRRLVTAFVSGAPGGREVEPARPGRTIVGGVALAVLLMAGAAIAGVFDPKTSIDFTEPNFIIAKDKGSIYVVIEPRAGDTEPTLRPITNVTSAQLIQSGWTSCTGTDLGIKTDVSENPKITPTPDAGFVVKRKGDYFLIAEEPATPTEPARAYSYPMPRNDGLNGDLQVALSEFAVEVPEQWLLLFPSGGSLDAEGLNLAGAGGRPKFAGSDALPRKARIGDFFFDVNNRPRVITKEGAAEFSDFAFRVLRNTEFRGKLPEDLRLDANVQLPTVPAPYEQVDAHWPASTLSPAEGQLCAVLRADRDAPPRALLAQAPTDEASAEDVDDPAAKEASVDSGNGAFVMSAGWGESADSAEPVLVDERGRAYPLVGPETAGKMGYKDDDWVLVPDSWVDLFGEGVPLSEDAALCPPTTEQGEETCQ